MPHFGIELATLNHLAQTLTHLTKWPGGKCRRFYFTETDRWPEMAIAKTTHAFSTYPKRSGLSFSNFRKFGKFGKFGKL